jgi:hypothetical protein
MIMAVSPAANIPDEQRFFHGGPRSGATLPDGNNERPEFRSRAAFYTLNRFDLFSPMCIILIDGNAKSKEADRRRTPRPG